MQRFSLARIFVLLSLLLIGGALTAVTLTGLSAAGRRALAVAADGERRVCASGCPYASVQAAVDAATPGDVIKVATGIYTGVQGRAAPVGYNGPPVITQVLYISKAVTVRGGYTTDFVDPPDPAANPTTLDAQRGGRVLFITGDVTATVQGLRLVGGDATGLGGGLEWVRNAGGGVFVYGSPALLSGNVISDNRAYRGAGVWLESTPATLQANSIVSNVASWAAGGVWINNSSATLIGDFVGRNDASFGGGLTLLRSPATLSGTIVFSNQASSEGGGVGVILSDATLWNNIIAANTVDRLGGGLYIQYSDVEMVNNLIADNHANRTGSGLHIQGSSPHLIHTTVARNTGGGGGVYIAPFSGGASMPVFTNTILVSHSVGIYVNAGSTATLEATLWGEGNWANDVDWTGGGAVITGTVDLPGDPDFAKPDAGDYHLGSGSAAIDAGVDAGVTTDMGGDPRPFGDGYDIGADEFRPPLDLYLPLVRSD
jgi:hypothetical protein